MALKMALPDLEGHAQHGRECAATVSPFVLAFLSCLPALLFPSGSCCEDEVLLLLLAQLQGFSGGTGSRACACRTSPSRVAAPALLDCHGCTSQKQKTPGNICRI